MLTIIISRNCYFLKNKIILIWIKEKNKKKIQFFKDKNKLALIR